MGFINFKFEKSIAKKKIVKNNMHKSQKYSNKTIYPSKRIYFLRFYQKILENKKRLKENLLQKIENIRKQLRKIELNYKTQQDKILSKIIRVMKEIIETQESSIQNELMKQRQTLKEKSNKITQEYWKIKRMYEQEISSCWELIKELKVD